MMWVTAIIGFVAGLICCHVDMMFVAATIIVAIGLVHVFMRPIARFYYHNSDLMLGDYGTGNWLIIAGLLVAVIHGLMLLFSKT